MKKNLLILITLTSFYTETAEKRLDFGKEQGLYDFSTQQTPRINQTSQPPQSLIQTIDNELNQRIPQGIFFQKSPHELTAQEYQSLAARVEQICPTISDPLIIKLVQKNSYFHSSLCHFIDIARKNLHGVSCATLDTVRNSLNQQPTPALNKLSPGLKKYVMDYAYGEIKYEHTIQFKGHTHPVCSWDINNPYGASTCTNGICKIWNILTGKERYTLITENKYGWVKFNQNGSLLATVLMPKKSDTTNTVIHIWKIHPSTSPQKHFYQIHHHNTHLPSKICFLGNNICVFETRCMTQYKLKKDGSTLNLGNVHCKSIGYNEDSPYPTSRDNRNNSWILIKNSPLLYLCKQAVTNTKLADNLPFITQKTTYQELWPHEQDTAKEYAQIERKINLR